MSIVIGSDVTGHDETRPELTHTQTKDRTQNWDHTEVKFKKYNRKKIEVKKNTKIMNTGLGNTDDAVTS